MAEITPEERVQKVKAHLQEDLDFEPEQVRNFYTTNIFGRVFAHLVGWTGKKARMLRCTAAGELKTAPTTTGIERYLRSAGEGPDPWATPLVMEDYASRFDIFIWDNPVNIRFETPEGGWGSPIEVPVGFYSVDVRSHSMQLQNKTAGQNARYQLIGWW